MIKKRLHWIVDRPHKGVSHQTRTTRRNESLVHYRLLIVFFLFFQAMIGIATTKADELLPKTTTQGVAVNSVQGEEELALDDLNDQPLSLFDSDIAIDTVLLGGSKTANINDPYNIGRSPVTAAQYCAFLNAVASVTDQHHLYDERMELDPSVASIIRRGEPGEYRYAVIEGRAHYPITYVDLFSSLRFCNWLENGALLNVPEGKEEEITERGSYTFEEGKLMDRVHHKVKWYLPNEEEWFRYQGNHKNGEELDLMVDARKQGSHQSSFSEEGSCNNFVNQSYSYQADETSFLKEKKPEAVSEWTQAFFNTSDSNLPFIVRGGWKPTLDGSLEHAVYNIGERFHNNFYLKSNQVGFRVAAAVRKNNVVAVVTNHGEGPAPLTFGQQVAAGAMETAIIATIAGLTAGIGIFGCGYLLSLLGEAIRVGTVTGAALAAGAAGNVVTSNLTKGSIGRKRIAAAVIGFIAASMMGLGIGCFLCEALLVPPPVILAGEVTASALPAPVTVPSSVATAVMSRTPSIATWRNYATIEIALIGSYMGRNFSSFLDPYVAKKTQEVAQQYF